MRKKIVLLGGGGHCHSVIDVIEQENKFQIIGIVDKKKLIGNDILGYKIYRDGVLVGTSNTNSFSADHLSPSTTYNFTVKAYDNAYLESPQSNTLNVTTLDNDIFSKDLQIVKYLEGTGNNKAFEIANKTGHKVSLNGYKLNIQNKGTVFISTKETKPLKSILPTTSTAFIFFIPSYTISI